MKLFKLYSLLVLILLTSCQKNDAVICFKDNLTATLTSVTNISNPVINEMMLNFEIHNHSSSNYSSETNPVHFRFVVTTTDNSTYESRQLLTIGEIKAGSKATIVQHASYGIGKTYKSVSYELFCE